MNEQISTVPVTAAGGSLVTMPRDQIRLHPELNALVKWLRQLCYMTGCPLERFQRPAAGPVRVLPDGTVVGNLAAYERLDRRGDRAAEVLVDEALAADDPAFVTLVAICSFAEGPDVDPLLVGMAYWEWGRYRAETIPFRDIGLEALEQRARHGCTRRQRLAAEVSRRLGRSMRDLQRLALLAELPEALLRLYLDGRATMEQLLRVAGAPRPVADAVVQSLREGLKLEEALARQNLGGRSHRHASISRARDWLCLTAGRIVADFRDRERPLPGVPGEDVETLRQMIALCEEIIATTVEEQRQRGRRSPGGVR